MGTKRFAAACRTSNNADLFFAGPGPGAYLLPTTVGYDRHDNRKQRMPQYSFGTRAGLASKNLGPGPGAYKVDRLTRYGVSRGNEFTIAPRTSIKGNESKHQTVKILYNFSNVLYTTDKNIGPGPGAHDVHLKPFFKGVNAPAYSMSWRSKFQYKNCAPGPNAYAVDVSPIKPGHPAYSMYASFKFCSTFAQFY